MMWLVPVLVGVVLAALGFTVGRLLRVGGSAGAVSGAEGNEAVAGNVDPAANLQSDTVPGWYYELEALVANLNEPGVTRYARVTLTLEVSRAMKQADGITFFETNKPRLKNWLTLYLSNKSLEDIRGAENLRRMQSEVTDLFNRGLFPNEPPKIKQVLFKELSIQ